MFWRRRKRNIQLDPDEIFLDAFNLPSFDTDQFEGRVVQQISTLSLLLLGAFFFLLTLGFLYRAWDLQVSRGSTFAELSENNRLKHSVVFAERGVIYDRRGKELAWNMPGEDFARRVYIDKKGFAHVLGFLGYPLKDAGGNWWRTEYVGKSGVERSFNDLLAGESGLQIVEVDAALNVQSQSLVRESAPGKNITLAIDADLQEALHNSIAQIAGSAGYVGGAAVILDVHSGEVLALTSYPEYSSSVMSEGENRAKILAYSESSGKPFMNRTIEATYAPGSIIKPYVAAAALEEDIINPTKWILSTGVLTIPNPYRPDLPSHFLDWKAHGFVNIRRAIAVSSNIYFYAIGGGLVESLGLGAQKGLGITKLADYAKRFGFGEATGVSLWGEVSGNVPTPRWKEEVFGEEWLLGNTYHSSIGQYGWLVTPLQAARYIAAIAGGGELLVPQILHGPKKEYRKVGVDDEHLQIVREGMRMAVTEGTLQTLYYGDLKIAAKTGTAQVGSNNEFKNSWVVGFWPNEKPQFAFAVVLERAPSYAEYGAINVSMSFFNWLRANAPEYTRGEYPE